MNVQSDNSSDVLTRQRLLDAAGEVFADHGFRAATVRDICRRAGANVAAVNYHFGDKEKLYLEVLRESHRCASEKYGDVGAAAALSGAKPEEKLRAHVRSFLLRIFDSGRPAWHGRLMSREMIDPSPALDVLV